MLTDLAVWVGRLALFDLCLVLTLIVSTSWHHWVAPRLDDRRARRRAIEELIGTGTRARASGVLSGKLR